jgi:hypothetical protein
MACAHVLANSLYRPVWPVLFSGARVVSLGNRVRECWAHVFAPPTSAELKTTVAWCIEQVEPQLKQVSGYPHRYEAAVAHALAHCQRLAQQIHAPIIVERSAFMQTPLVRALFATADDIPVVLSKSRTVRDWQQNPLAQDFVALMGVRLKEKQVFGMALNGEVVHRDVAQQIVMFSDHTFSALGEDEQAVRVLLVREFLGALLEYVRDRVSTLRASRQQGLQQRDRGQVVGRRESALLRHFQLSREKSYRHGLLRDQQER